MLYTIAIIKKNGKTIEVFAPTKVAAEIIKKHSDSACETNIFQNLTLEKATELFQQD